MELANEPEERGPELTAFVIKPFTFPGAGERLAGETGTPNRSFCRPVGESQGFGPTGDSVEEMALAEVLDFMRLNVFDGFAGDESVRNESVFYQLGSPSAGEGIDVVVEIHGRANG